MSPLVSIIIPAYNRADLIIDTLDSIHDQTYTNWECLIIDDGSTDSTCDIVLAYGQNDTRFRLLKRENTPKGGGACRNLGVNHSKGEYIMYLDSDDLLKKDCLADRVAMANQYPTNSFWVFQSELFSLTPGDQKKIPNLLSKETNDVKRFISFDYPWNVSASLIDKSWLLKTEVKWDESLFCHQDIDYNLQLLSYSPNYKKFEDICDVYIRMGSNDKLSRKQLSVNHLKSKVRLLKNICAYFKSDVLQDTDFRKRFYSLSIMYGTAIWASKKMDFIKDIRKILANNGMPSYLFIPDLLYSRWDKANHISPLYKILFKVYHVIFKPKNRVLPIEKETTLGKLDAQ